MWQSIFSTLRDEFADLSDPAQFTRVAYGCWWRSRSARSSATSASARQDSGTAHAHAGRARRRAGDRERGASRASEPADMTRVLQGLFAGIGFLGAGAILKLDEKERVKGLTTAASIWATAAIAAAAGLGGRRPPCSRPCSPTSFSRCC